MVNLRHRAATLGATSSTSLAGKSEWKKGDPYVSTGMQILELNNLQRSIFCVDELL